MATRATIIVEGFTIAKLYKHWDGYPDSTLPWLKKFNEDFTKERGFDPSYKFAQLIRSSVRDAEEFGLDSSEYTGWGVVPVDADMDQDFEYRLLNNGEVTFKSL